MKIDDLGKPRPGSPLSSFNAGDCVRLVGGKDGLGEPFIGHVYIVVDFNAHRLAINLSGGCHRETGRFVLEPNARVVIE